MEEAASSSSLPKQPLSKHKKFWRLRRRKRMDQLPLTMAICATCFFSLQFLAERGTFEGWRPSQKVGAQPHLAQQSGAIGSSLGFTGGAADLSHGRQLATAITPYGVINLTAIVCPAEGNSSSTFPSLDGMDPASGMTFKIIVTLYMFLGLAIICDSFFEAALSAICEAMNLKDDVAGATWMAAGGSAPELMTSIIGVFVSFSDVGFGTIVGSAVFNVLFVIACCAFVAPNLKLTWWPLARDASYYCFSLAMIVIFVSDDLAISHYEAIILLLMYVGYVTVMYYNERLEAWVTSRIAINEQPPTGARAGLVKIIESPVFALFLNGAILTNTVVVIMEIMEFNSRQVELPCMCGVHLGASILPYTALYYINLAFNIFFIFEMLIKFHAYGFFGYWKIPLNCFDGSLVFLIVVEFILNASGRGDVNGDPTQDANNAIGVGVARTLRIFKVVRFIRTLRVLRISRFVANQASGSSGGDAPGSTARVTPADGDVEAKKDRVAQEKQNGEGEPAKEAKEEEAGGDDDEEEDDGPFNPFEIWGDFDSPGGVFGRIMWVISLPLSLGMWLTVPDCRRDMFKKWWLGTFAACIAWIAGLSYVMVWMVESIGDTLDIPESIMGIFVLAAGTSIPDCLSSVAVARRGHGDMAVSSSIGSNIFDVLIGLPVPWFIYTVIMPRENVLISSESLAVMILMLFVMVALVITLIHLSGWILSVRLGMGMMFLYLIFLVLALLLDREVMFPPCVDNNPYTYVQGPITGFTYE